MQLYFTLGQGKKQAYFKHLQNALGSVIGFYLFNSRIKH